MILDLPRPILIGMVHLPPLPGSPGYELEMGDLIAGAVRDARTLVDAGFAALMIENFGDTPFVGGQVEPVTVAAMTVAAGAVSEAAQVPIGINVLRNDARSALGIAAAVGARFIRINIHLGVSATDQGMIEGQARQTVELRDRIAPQVAILADVHVKHAVALSQPDIALAAEEIAYRGLADGLVVSGATTGRPTDLADIRRVKEAVPDRPILIGSGVTPETIATLLAVADGAIVGTSIKLDGGAGNPVDPKRAQALVAAARNR